MASHYIISLTFALRLQSDLYNGVIKGRRSEAQRIIVKEQRPHRSQKNEHGQTLLYEDYEESVDSSVDFHKCENGSEPEAVPNSSLTSLR